ncbi:MAG: threonylcarbamoyl-AMP synthase [Clostridiales bacterium]|nr:threonylcarbamoyl-AMP synthase [Clostridiales bacterium]
MNTQLLPANDESLSLAARLLADGQLVAFPTETVYGLGANALDAQAVLGIFAAKGRPGDNPLIVHIHDRRQLADICEVTPDALRLMDAFWPGPLTIILPRKPGVPNEVTANLDTVAVRMPSHPVAQALLRACDLPIAAPSANRSGKPSPTAARHVFDDMDGRIPLIIDGGESDVGLESTVISLAGDKPCILRPGGITQAMLESVLGPVELAGSILRPLEKGEKALSPGMMYKHYSPDGQVTLIEGAEADVVEALRRLYAHAAGEGHRACVMCFTEHMDALRDCAPHDIGSKTDASEVAHRLFNTLRLLDEEKMDVIFSEVVPPEGVGLAVMNRLGRAAAFRTVQAKEITS